MRLKKILINPLNAESFTLLQRGGGGFSEREVYKYAMDFDLRGYVKAEPILGGKIFSVMLTVEGIEFARMLRLKYDR